jgi:NAD-dependent aldehyde dehydrogenases
MRGAYSYAGQICISIQRVLAHESIVDPLIERLRQRLSALVVGDPAAGETDVGPKMSEEQTVRAGGMDQRSVGGVMINDGSTYRVDQMPYGGVKSWGLDREGVRYVIEELTDAKLIALNLADPE